MPFIINNLIVSEQNHPDFISGWNSCLHGKNSSGESSTWHNGWMACCAAMAADNGSALNILHRAESDSPDVIVSFRPEFDLEEFRAAPKKQSIMTPLPLHAVVLVGWERLKENPLEAQTIDEIRNNRDCSVVFRFSKETRFPQIVRGLGAFSTAAEAKRNGWDKDVPMGLTFHPIRINRIRGEIAIHKI